MSPSSTRRCPSGLIITTSSLAILTSSPSSEAVFLLSNEAKFNSLKFRIKEKGSEPTAHVVVGQEPDIELRKLKGHGKLIVELMDNVKELEEDGGEAIILAGVVKVAPFEKIRVNITNYYYYLFR